MNDNFQNNLLQTIRIPKNLLFLTDRLPGANYDKNKRSDNKKKSQSRAIEKEPNIITLDVNKEKELILSPSKKQASGKRSEEKKSIHQILKEHEEEREKRLKMKEEKIDLAVSQIKNDSAIKKSYEEKYSIASPKQEKNILPNINKNPVQGSIERR